MRRTVVRYNPKVDKYGNVYWQEFVVTRGLAFRLTLAAVIVLLGVAWAVGVSSTDCPR